MWLIKELELAGTWPVAHHHHATVITTHRRVCTATDNSISHFSFDAKWCTSLLKELKFRVFFHAMEPMIWTTPTFLYITTLMNCYAGLRRADQCLGCK